MTYAEYIWVLDQHTVLIMYSSPSWTPAPLDHTRPPKFLTLGNGFGEDSNHTSPKAATFHPTLSSVRWINRFNLNRSLSEPGTHSPHPAQPVDQHRDVYRNSFSKKWPEEMRQKSVTSLGSWYACCPWDSKGPWANQRVVAPRNCAITHQKHSRCYNGAAYRTT